MTSMSHLLMRLRPSSPHPNLPPQEGRESKLKVVCCVLVAMTLAGSVSAQEVEWREDYNGARREAQERGLPLVLDFSTENCFWCKKLEDTTFRDPQVAPLLRERFVPLKVDAQRNSALTEALRIQSFPTLVLAAPDGKILGTLEGYVEAGRFHEQLQRALASLTSPEWMTRDYQEASKAIAISEYARAVLLLKSVLEDDRELPIQVKSRQLLNELEQQAAGCLAHAKQLEEKGQINEALDALSELLRAYAGTRAAVEAGQSLTVLSAKPEIKSQLRTRRARDLLAQAREDQRAKQYFSCLEHCEYLITTYPDMAEGVQAAQLAAEIKNDPESMRQVCDTMCERLGSFYLALAETWLKKGQPQEAAMCLERIVQAFPGSRNAEVAQSRLAQLQGQPARRTDFKKP